MPKKERKRQIRQTSEMEAEKTKPSFKYKAGYQPAAAVVKGKGKKVKPVKSPYPTLKKSLV